MNPAEGPMRVRVDRDKCIGSGQCVLRVPEVFDQGDDDGLVVLLETNPRVELRESVRSAASFCPSGAISIDGGRDDR
jgi:ferredoxin